MKRNNRRSFACGLTGCLVSFWFVSSAAPSWAYGNGWDWCDSISFKSNSSASTSKVVISGACDGGRVSITGTMTRRDGSIGLRGYVGSTRVQLGASVGSYTAFNGYMGDARVKVYGSGSRHSCDLDQSVDGELESAMVGNLFMRICPTLNGLKR